MAENTNNASMVVSVVIQIITIILVVLSWRLIPYFTEKDRKIAEVGLLQYQGMNEVHTKTAEIFYNWEQRLTQLMKKYDIKAGQENDLINKMSSDEKEEVNKYIKEVNLLLAKMFMVMSDEKWTIIQGAIKPDKAVELRDIRESLIVAMRRTQFPDTKFNKREDLRLFQRIE